MEDGFTLSELIITLGISVLIFSLIISVYILCQRSFIKSSDKSELIQNARVFIDRLSRELRQTPEIITILPLVIDEAPSEIMFQDGHDISQIKYIKYYLDGSDLKRQLIHYTFADDPSNYVKWNLQDGVGNPPTETIEEDILVGEYVSVLKFYGQGGLITAEARFLKGAENIHIYEQIAGRNL